MSDFLRIVISLWVLVALGRSARHAFGRRELVAEVWRGARGRTWLAAMGLLAVVMVTASALLAWAPPLRWGLGRLVGFEGNAVFTPLEEAAQALGPAPAQGPDWGVALLATCFLGLLLLLLPWLAFVEEELFRAGLERESLGGEIVWALRFGLVHLVMLVPIGATLAISVAGFAYGRRYRRVVATAHPADVPLAAVAAFRPTRRSSRAARATDRAETRDRDAATVAVLHLDAERRQAAGVLASASLHTAFNASVVVIVWLAIVIPALSA